MKHRIRGVRWLALAALVCGVVAVPSALADDAPGPGRHVQLGHLVRRAERQAGGRRRQRRRQQGREGGVPRGGEEGRRSASRSVLRSTRSGTGFRSGRGADAAKLKDIKGVKAVYPVLAASIPPTDNISPELATAIAMTGADVAQATRPDRRGHQGRRHGHGLRPRPPGPRRRWLRPGSVRERRVVAQYDFVGDAYNAEPRRPAYNPTPVPDPIADDCNGHGTHVSGIVGANGAVDGRRSGRDVRRVPRLRLRRLDQRRTS